MCKECGCGLPEESPAGASAHDREPTPGHSHDSDSKPDHEHEHGPGEHHGHPHGHSHTHPHVHSHEEPEHDQPLKPGVEGRRTVKVRRAILDKNDRLAERNRGFFRARGLLVLNLLSAPGSGKTTFIREAVRMLQPQLKTAIIVGDLATDNDARRLRESGAPVVQINTGTVCHLEAEMVGRAVGQLDLNGVQLLIIENVGNLVCPASYDLGEDLRVVLLSVTEGEDKPLKYPPMFQSANVVVVSKTDLAAACGYDRDVALANIRRVAPKARVFETSAKTGAGLEVWRDFLVQQHKQGETRDPLGL
jgi:hydrogenase nickel incorporation protein HypB